MRRGLRNALRSTALITPLLLLGAGVLAATPAAASGLASVTTLSSSANPSVSGQAVTLTATVAPGSGTGTTPTGSVTFSFLGAAHLACTGGDTKALSAGTASCTLPTLGAGSDSAFTVTASYGGDTTYDLSQGTLGQAVASAGTTLALATNLPPAANPPVSGRSFSVTATVAPVAPGGGTPTGTVSFVVAGSSGPDLGCSAGTTPTLSRATGTATCRFSPGELTGGLSPYSITATYSGDANFTGSTNAFSQPVLKAATRIHLSASPVPVIPGTTVKFTGSLTWVTPETYAPVPTGSITFSFTKPAAAAAITCVGGTNTVAVATSGSATCSVTTFTTPGTYTVTASYGGDANDTGASSLHSMTFKVK